MKNVCAFLLLTLAPVLLADGPADNIPDKVRPVPAPGIDVPPEKKAQLETGLAELKGAIDGLHKLKDPALRDLIPDVEIYYRAVHDGLTYREFLQASEIEQAFALLEVGKARAANLKEGHAPWTTQTGLVVRGYVSRLDDSVQPYGMLVPETYSAQSAQGYRLDIWFHGRSEVLTEGNFLVLRTKSRDAIGVYAPRNTLVLFPYGRFCNAAKFAGEVDALEALADARRHYRIDDERISVRGFSMGGASAWHFAVHYADRWFAANPGAGFAETPRFLSVFQNETLNPTPWEKKLLNWYDCDKWALNLSQCPTIAYSGEIDTQKQAADVMSEALLSRGIDLVHIISPKTKHQVMPIPAAEVERRMVALARDGRRRVPREVAFETYTLKYNRMAWVTIDGMKEHWERAEVRAAIDGDSSIRVDTKNVTDITFNMEPGDCPFDVTEKTAMSIDGQTLVNLPHPKSDRSWNVSLHRDGKTWKPGPREGEGLRKIHDLQGPVDDALLNPFIFVRPTGTSTNQLAAKWVTAEMDHAIDQWRRQFRGNAIVKDDSAVTPGDIANKNLILWGDPASNALIKKIADKLPIKWDAEFVTVGAKKFEAAHHAPILIYPNPLNPAHYIVLNSSFTYREYHYLNNARQVPMLPDWAVVDLNVAPNTISPGKIADAGFFDEHWQVRSSSIPRRQPVE